MGYFNDKKSTNISKDAVERLSEICLDELMFSSDAYICMIAMNLQGYKRLHRYISKKWPNNRNNSLSRYSSIISINNNKNRFSPSLNFLITYHLIS